MVFAQSRPTLFHTIFYPNQQHSQDLLNVRHLVSTTKSLIQALRDDRWEPLLASVISFCEQHEIDIPDMNAHYTKGRGRYRRQDDDLTMEHHFNWHIYSCNRLSIARIEK